MPSNMTASQFAAACAPFANVSHETMARLQTYADLLEKWQARINLVSKATLPDLWRRHFLDSAQLLAYLPDPAIAPARIADLGSGAGFPGLVLAAFGHQVTMVESDQRKVAFMSEVARQAGIASASFLNQRIESAKPFKVDFVTARALADTALLLEYSEPFLALGQPGETQALYLKGDKINEELTFVSKGWHTDHMVTPSLTDPNGSVLLIRKASRV